MKKNKKVFVIIFLLIIILATIIYAIISTYATFRSEFSGEMKLENATWRILVNKTDISSSTVKNFTIDTINVDESQGVEPGKLAPGLRGNFNILIDPTDTDVSIKYEIKIDTSNLNTTNIEVESVEETNIGNKLVLTGVNSYTGIIHLDDIKNGITQNIKINLIWAEDGDQDINVGGIPNNKIQIPVQIKFTQYLGEEIVEYNG